MLRMIDDKLIKKIEGVIDSNGKLEAGELNRKLYCHPIYVSFARTPYKLFTFTCLIFNNDPVAFTASTFMTWAVSLFTDYPNASIMASGYIDGDPVSRIKKHPDEPDKIALEATYKNGDDYENGYWTIELESLTQEGAIFNDGVNEIFPNL